MTPPRSKRKHPEADLAPLTGERGRPYALTTIVHLATRGRRPDPCISSRLDIQSSRSGRLTCQSAPCEPPVGVRDAGAGDRPAGRRARGHRPRRDPRVQPDRAGRAGPSVGGRPSPPDQRRRRGVHRRDGHDPPGEARAPVHPLERPQARRLPAPTNAGPAWCASAGNGCGRSCASTGITFQRTRTWKESTDPDKDAKLDRIEQVTSRFPDRCFAFDQFGPLSIRPHHGTGWAPQTAPGPAAGDLPPHPRHPLLPRLLQPRRRPAVGRDAPPQRRRPHPGRAASRSAPPARTAHRSTSSWTTCRRTRPRRSGPGPRGNKVELCLTPTNASWANPIEAQFGPLRSFTMAELGPPQPHRAGPRAAGLPALAQRQRPPPRRPGRPTPRTRPRPQRTPTPLGPTPRQAA